MLEVGFLGNVRLRPIHSLGAVQIDGASPVAHDDVLRARADQQSGDADTRDACAADDDPHVGEFFADHLEGIDERTQNEHPGAVMLVREDRDIGGAFEMVGDGKGARAGDIVDTDRAEGGGHSGANFDDLGHIAGAETEWERIDTGKGLEENAFPFFDGNGRFWRAALSSEKIGPIGDQRNRVTTAGEIERFEWILLDGKTRFGYARGVDERKNRTVPQRDFAIDANEAPIATSILESVAFPVVAQPGIHVLSSSAK